MLENVYIKTGGTSKCFSSDSGHGSGKMIQLYQVSGALQVAGGSDTA